MMCPESGRTDGDEWEKLDEALRGLLPLSKEERATARESLAESRLQGRQIIHGAKVRLDDDGRCAWTSGGEERWCALQQLLDRLAKEHKIPDRDALADAVDNAALIYHHSRSALDEKDVAQLLTSIPKVTDILSREENDHRIAEILMDRDTRSLLGAAGRHDQYHEQYVAIVTRIWQISADLSQLAIMLGQPGTRGSDVELHRMLVSLEEYWEKLPGKKLTKTFSPNDRKLGRRRAASEAMKFVEAVVQFVAPRELPKLPSAIRHRLERLKPFAKRRT